jgi:hypothetical protein
LVTQSLSISIKYVVPEEVGEGAVTREATQERGEEGETLRRGGTDGGEREGWIAERSAFAEEEVCVKGNRDRESATVLSSPLM